MPPASQTPARTLVAFFALTFAVTWSFFIAAGTLTGRIPGALRMLLIMLGVFTPAMVALLFTARAEGSAGVTALLGRLIRWRAGVRWYIFAIGFMAAVKLTVAAVERVATGAWPRFGTTPVWAMVAATVVSTVVGGQAGEEIGWRGYALPRMAKHIGFGRASLVLGVIWASWHLPLFFFPGSDLAGQSFPVFLLQVMALSVAMAWLYLKSGGSLLLTMLMHAAGNNTKDIVPSAVTGAANAFALSRSLVAWLTLAVLWICAGYFLVRMRGANLPGTVENGDPLPSAVTI